MPMVQWKRSLLLCLIMSTVCIFLWNSSHLPIFLNFSCSSFSCASSCTGTDLQHWHGGIFQTKPMATGLSYMFETCWGQLLMHMGSNQDKIKWCWDSATYMKWLQRFTEYSIWPPIWMKTKFTVRSHLLYSLHMAVFWNVCCNSSHFWDSIFPRPKVAAFSRKSRGTLGN